MLVGVGDAFAKYSVRALSANSSCSVLDGVKGNECRCYKTQTSEAVRAKRERGAICDEEAEGQVS